MLTSLLQSQKLPDALCSSTQLTMLMAGGPFAELWPHQLIKQRPHRRPRPSALAPTPEQTQAFSQSLYWYYLRREATGLFSFCSRLSSNARLGDPPTPTPLPESSSRSRTLSLRRKDRLAAQPAPLFPSHPNKYQEPKGRCSEIQEDGTGQTDFLGLVEGSHSTALVPSSAPVFQGHNHPMPSGEPGAGLPGTVAGRLRILPGMQSVGL